LVLEALPIGERRINQALIELQKFLKDGRRDAEQLAAKIKDALVDLGRIAEAVRKGGVAAPAKQARGLGRLWMSPMQTMKEMRDESEYKKVVKYAEVIDRIIGHGERGRERIEEARRIVVTSLAGWPLKRRDYPWIDKQAY
jgi:hypothetical protein